MIRYMTKMATEEEISPFKSRLYTKSKITETKDQLFDSLENIEGNNFLKNIQENDADSSIFFEDNVNTFLKLLSKYTVP